MALRTKGNNRRRSTSIFSSKLICGDCGNFYGSKVWHSNTKYRRTVWRCNHKYGNDEKCQTPHLTEDEIKEIFIKATNQLVDMKDEVISNYDEMKEMLFGTVDLESEQGKLEDELNEVASLIEDCINENARVALDQSEYEKRYNSFVERFDKANGRLEEVKVQITERQARGQQIEIFLKTWRRLVCSRNSKMIYSLHWLKTLRLEGIKWWSGSRMALRWKVKLSGLRHSCLMAGVLFLWYSRKRLRDIIYRIRY